MKRKIKVLSIFLALFFVTFTFSSCGFSFDVPFLSGANEDESEPFTDINGKTIPTYNDVSVNPFDPAFFTKDENGRMVYADGSVKTYTGIDVSVFQGDIDWEKVKADGIDFVMLRAGYRGYGPKGKIGIDENFRKNAEEASKAGLKLGAYFFSQAINEKEAVEEAEFLLDTIKGTDITFPVAFDWEVIDYATARTDNMTSDMITKCAIAFCDTVSAAGYQPLIYFNCELGYFSYDLSKVGELHFWLAEYSEIPSFYYDYKMLQYSKTGKVDGINGDVDMNILFFDYFEDAVG